MIMCNLTYWFYITDNIFNSEHLILILFNVFNNWMLVAGRLNIEILFNTVFSALKDILFEHHKNAA